MHTNRVSRLATALTSASVVFAAFAFSAFAAGPTPTTASGGSPTPVVSDPSLTAAGVPTITDRSPMGYYLWRSGDDRVHLATHGPGDEHNFDARIHTEGVIENVVTTRLENRDNYRIEDGGHTLVLHFHTYNFTDGVSFTVRGAERLELGLKLDGSLISTSGIYIGAAGRHPEHNPFHIRV
ncbi:MAG: outer membrane protein [Chloroflexota bacterium]|jgi:hypothetical protein|nr:outer membrane protein [Chloroflexota bacterium]